MEAHQAKKKRWGAKNAEAIEEYMAAHGGEVPVEVLDAMSDAELADVVKHAKHKAQELRERVEAERARIALMPDGPEKDAALAALAKLEAECEVAEAAAAALEAHQAKKKRWGARKAEAVEEYMAAHGGCLLYTSPSPRDS